MSRKETKIILTSLGISAIVTLVAIILQIIFLKISQGGWYLGNTLVSVLIFFILSGFIIQKRMGKQK